MFPYKNSMYSVVVSVQFIFYAPLSAMEALEIVQSEHAHYSNDTFMLLHKEFGPPVVKGTVKTACEGIRRGQLKYFLTRVPVHSLTYQNEIRDKQNFLCLQDKDSILIFDYDKHKQYSYRCEIKGLSSVTYDGRSLVLFYGTQCRVISLEENTLRAQFSVKGSIRTVKNGKIITSDGDLIHIYLIATGELLDVLGSGNYSDFAMLSDEAMISRSFTIAVHRDKEGTTYSRNNNPHNFLLHDLTKERGDDLKNRGESIVINPQAPPSREAFKLFIVGSYVITLQPVSVNAVVGEFVTAHQLGVRDRGGNLLSSFTIPLKWNVMYTDVSKAGICIHGDLMNVTIASAIHVCNIKTGDMKVLPHDGAYVCCSNDKIIISGARNGTVRIWDARTCDLLASYSHITPLKQVGKANFFALSADGLNLIIGRRRALSNRYSVLSCPISVMDDCNHLEADGVKAQIAALKAQGKKGGIAWKALLKK